MTSEDSAGVEALPWRSLRPFVSVVVLECTADDLAAGFSRLTGQLLQPRRGVALGSQALVALGQSEGRNQTIDGAGSLADLGIDQVWGSVRRHQRAPSWSGRDSIFVDTEHLLTVALRRGRLVAVHAEHSIQAGILRWLYKEPRPPFRRVPPWALEGALLQGEANGLWLRGTHRRRRTKPDTKTLSGRGLQDSLDPHADRSFALSAGCSELGASPDRTVLTGKVGTTPEKSTVWFKATTDFATFVTAVVELLVLLDKTMVDGPAESQFSILARQIDDISPVWGAYEVLVDPPDHLTPEVAGNDDLRDAAVMLEDALLEVHGTASQAFTMDVGLDGSISGCLGVRPVPVGGGYRLDIGFRGEPTNLRPVRGILDALGNGELLTVHYRSGHAFTGGQFWEARTSVAGFPQWTFADFAGYRVDQEKPKFKAPQAIHDAIGAPDDRSLFSWVVARYTDGWLICDDGSGEVADFLHISPDGTVSAIHVKGARNASSNRRVSAAAYEVVVGQAVKNLPFADANRLRERLAAPALAGPACWTYGVRVTGRGDFLDSFDIRDATDGYRVVVVQPHMRESHYRDLRREGVEAPQSAERMRLALLETLLNSARSSAVGIGSDLEVIASV
ncbi:hypothetical protein [Actinokineospora xionganensis]|uniref:Sporadically distributed protein, TIGR04141 family n=1 Tax=Actinokineospora xionganensis TaxID=2684470 RepID=A0ABR7L6P8_9PSEU|nr:hypothetical protein [Actinokineospora xionganensis]MBC6448084.1 hypothetical protein [Actinokineospora xionganensis]